MGDDEGATRPGTLGVMMIFASGFAVTSWGCLAIGARISGHADSHFGPYGWLIVPAAFAILGALLATAGFGFGLVVSRYRRRATIVRLPRVAAWVIGPTTAAACLALATLAHSVGGRVPALLVYAGVPVAVAAVFTGLLSRAAYRQTPR
jgi:hypothetical protein